jgi:hypothetical protein
VAFLNRSTQSVRPVVIRPRTSPRRPRSPRGACGSGAAWQGDHRTAVAEDDHREPRRGRRAAAAGREWVAGKSQEELERFLRARWTAAAPGRPTLARGSSRPDRCPATPTLKVTVVVAAAPVARAAAATTTMTRQRTPISTADLDNGVHLRTSDASRGARVRASQRGTAHYLAPALAGVEGPPPRLAGVEGRACPPSRSGIEPRER